jgi:hypothetical protein
MASQQKKAFCVLHFEVSRSVITVQREFRARFKKTHHTAIMYEGSTDSLWKLDACVKAEVLVDLVCPMTTLKVCVRSFSEVPASQGLRARRELGMPKMTVWKLLRSPDLKP